MQWLDAEKAPQHFPKQKCRRKKVMMTVWWFALGLIHYSFIKLDGTITAKKYCREIDEMY